MTEDIDLQELKNDVVEQVEDSLPLTEDFGESVQEIKDDLAANDAAIDALKAQIAALELKAADIGEAKEISKLMADQQLAITKMDLEKKINDLEAKLKFKITQDELDAFFGAGDNPEDDDSIIHGEEPDGNESGSIIKSLDISDSNLIQDYNIKHRFKTDTDTVKNNNDIAFPYYVFKTATTTFKDYVRLDTPNSATWGTCAKSLQVVDSQHYFQIYDFYKCPPVTIGSFDSLGVGKYMVMAHKGAANSASATVAYLDLSGLGDTKATFSVITDIRFNDTSGWIEVKTRDVTVPATAESDWTQKIEAFPCETQTVTGQITINGETKDVTVAGGIL